MYRAVKTSAELERAMQGLRAEMDKFSKGSKQWFYRAGMLDALLWVTDVCDIDVPLAAERSP